MSYRVLGMIIRILIKIENKAGKTYTIEEAEFKGQNAQERCVRYILEKWVNDQVS